MVNYLKNNSGLMVVRTLAAIPFIIWFFIMPIGVRLSSVEMIFRSLGQITGLTGMAMLSINFILAARFRFLDGLFNGLNRVYLRHHVIGVIAFCLILLHPTFLIIQYLFISLNAAFIFILPGNLPVDLGKIALVVFIALMVITLYLNFKYQNWKNTHKFLGVVLILGIFHMLYVPSDILNNSVLRYYMIGLATAGIFSYLYRTVLGIYKKSEYEYKLEKVTKINDTVVQLVLKPLSSKIKFLPGQFVFLRFQHDGILSESHPFSITSSSADDLSLVIKTLGDYTSMVYLLRPGVICRIEGPFGTFSYTKAQSKRQIWIAGGIGITPFFSMARQIDYDGGNSGDYNIDLYYSLKNEDEAVFSQELSEISRRNSNFKFHPYFSEKSGYISAQFVVSNSVGTTDADVFLCGPKSFMGSLRNQFIKLGFVNYKIHSEEFSL